MRTIDFRGKAVGSGRWVHGDLVWMGRQPAIFEYADFENGCVTIQEKTLGMNTGLRERTTMRFMAVTFLHIMAELLVMLLMMFAVTVLM